MSLKHKQLTHPQHTQCT